jgi:ABC-type multidrug transport system fused ATPase/permease subunit
MNTIKFRQAYRLIPVNHRREGLWVILLLIINSHLEFLSVASFVPLIFLIVDPDFVESNAFTSLLYHFFAFPSTRTFLLTLTGLIFIFLIIKNMVSVSIVKRKINYAFEIGSFLALKSMKRYTRITFLDFSHVDFTRELNRVTNYPFAFANNIIIPVTTLISEIFVCFLFIVGMAYFDYKMLVVIFLILIPASILYQLRKKSLSKVNHDLKNKYPALLKSALQIVEAYPEITTYNKEPFFLNKFQELNRALTKVFIKDQSLQAGTIRFTEIIVGLTLCSLVAYTVLFYEHYEQALLLLGIYCAAGFRMIPSANRILNALQQIRVHDYLMEELSSSSNPHQHGDAQSTVETVFESSISLRNIFFKYPNGPMALQDLSLTINKGDKIGIIGNSGEGKTTLLLVLLRLLKETSGEILIDGKCPSSETSWKQLIGYVPQSPYIVDGSICENIAFGIPPAEIDRVKVTNLLSVLELNDFVRHLPSGIDTRIGERGAKLSGGQKQRLAIGRALYIDAPVLLLDEVTNQIHAAAELEIMNVLEKLSNDKKTIVMVTHKIPRHNFFDSIYRLEKGKLYEEVITH